MQLKINNNCDKTGNFIAKGYFKCRNQSIFIQLENVCNKIFDCKYGNDEIFCFKNSSKILPNFCSNHISFDIICNFLNINIKQQLNNTIKKLTIKNLKKFSSFSLIYLYELMYLNISFGFIEFLNENSYLNLIVLDLSDNQISNITNNFLSTLIKLQYLNLRDNPIKSWDDPIFSSTKNLNYLDISKTKIAHLSENSFAGLANLEILKISYSRLKRIDYIFSKNLLNLKEFHLNNSVISEHIQLRNSLKFLKNVQYFYNEKYTICCFLQKINTLIKVCYPNKSVILDCSSLIGKLFIKYSIYSWLIIELISNFISFLNQLNSKQKNKKKFFIGLILSNFLYKISMKNISEYENYTKTKYLCKICKIIFGIGLLNSNFFSLLITLEICQYLRKFDKLNIIIIITIICNIFLSLTPEFLNKVMKTKQ